MPSIADLYDMLKSYARDALPGGALNPEGAPVAKQAGYLSGLLDPESQVSQDAQNWHKRTQTGLADQLAGRNTLEAEQAYQTMMQAAGMAPVGMVAWHGSPHKFDKFSLDKIGTGEGAQAYGHGLYLAESPDVAQSYQALGHVQGNVAKVGRTSLADLYDQIGNTEQQLFASPYIDQATKNARGRFLSDQKAMLEDLMGNKIAPDVLSAAKENGYHPDALKWFEKSVMPRYKPSGNLYKTDIPDEAVARFLDWDKPLSQQAPEVRSYAEKVLASEMQAAKSSADGWGDLSAPFSLMDEMTGSQFLQRLRDGKATAENIIGGGGADVSNALRQGGIPGIRYLDGGSRSAGQGSSNFVAFDPEMIRILERNGQATGLQPWKPGEYRLRDLITN